MSVYSLAMALGSFSLIAWLGGRVLKREENRIPVLFGAVLALSLVRVMVPLDFQISAVLPSFHLYPWVVRFLGQRILGNFSIGSCLLVVWIVGSLVKLFLLGKKLIFQRKFRIHIPCTLQLEDRLSLLMEPLRDEVGYYGRLLVSVSPQSTTAYQSGYLYPHILLPGNAVDFSDEDLLNMLRHELHHFLSGDAWIMLGIQVLNCLLWWNPVMPLFTESAGQLLELRCDRRVVRGRGMMARFSYGSTLLALASQIAEEDRDPVSLGYTGKTAEVYLRQRILVISSQDPTPAEKRKLLLGYLVCFLIFIASYLVIIQPAGYPPSGPENGIAVTSENCYLVREPEGDYGLYYEDGSYVFPVYEEDLLYEPFSELTIYEGDSSDETE